MTARYWVAKHVSDVFRNEPKNVGVIVDVNGVVDAQFFAERDDGSFDGRSLRRFDQANLYLQWVEFWREEIKTGSLQYILDSGCSNFMLAEGGEVRGCDGEDARSVCGFLFTSLVGSGLAEAFDWGEETEISAIHLAQDVTEELRRFNLIAEGTNLLVRNPMQRNKPVSGKQAVHTPDFVQKNGHLAAFETVDFTMKQHQRVRDRAGWAAYMFSDIRDANADLEAFTIVRAPTHITGEALEYASKMLSGESVIVNWLDDQDRERFLSERVRVADMIHDLRVPS